MNFNAYNGTNKGKYGLRPFEAILNYGNCGELAEYYCVADNLEDAIEEVKALVAKYNADTERNCGILISPRWISKKHEGGNSSCVYEF